MKFKKVFIFLTLIHTGFALFACSANNKTNDQRLLKMDYFKNKFPNIGDLAIVNQLKTTTNLEQKDLTEYSKYHDNNYYLFYKKLTDKENTYSFYNAKERTEFELKCNVPEEKFYKFSAHKLSENFIVIEKTTDNTLSFYSQKDGKLLVDKISNDAVTHKIIDYLALEKYEYKSIDLIKHRDISTQITTKYYFYNYEKYDSEEFIKYDRNNPYNNINKEKDLVAIEYRGYTSLYYQNKLYDEFKTPSNNSYYILENNNIIFQNVTSFDKEAIGDNFNYYQETIEDHSGVKTLTYIFKHYLYNFKTKKISEIKLPYLITDITANRKDSKGKLLYSNNEITNKVKLRFIDPKTKEIEKNTYTFIIDSNFKKHQYVEGIDDFGLVKLSNNKYLKIVGESYYLLNEKGQTEFIFGKEYNIVDFIQNRYIVCKDDQNDPNSELVIYDLTKFDSKTKIFNKVKAYAISDKSFRYFFRNEENEVFLLNDGKLNKLDGKFYKTLFNNILVTKEENKYYFYDILAKRVAEIKADDDSLNFDVINSIILKINEEENLHLIFVNYSKDTKPKTLLISYKATITK